MRKVILFTAALLILLSFSISTFAQDLPQNPFSERYRLPKVETNENGDKCLNPEQWNQVIKIASEYKGLYEWRLEHAGIVADHAFLVNKYETLIKNYELQLKIFGQRNEYLTKRLDQERKNALKLKMGDRLEKVGMWGVIVGELIVIGVLAFK